MRVKCFVGVAAFIALVVCAGAQAEDSAFLLEKGIYLEETKGDLDGAIEAYRQIIENARANEPHIAEAHYRLAVCYLKKGQEQDAAATLKTLTTRFPDQADLQEKARRLLDQLLYRDPAVLMPPEALLYVEMGSPGRQVEKILHLLEDTPFANPLAAMRGGAGPETGAGGQKTPGDIMAALLNPSMIDEFKKVRGFAFSLLAVGNNPPFVAVLYPGESDALRGLITAALGMAGQPGETVEGMQTIRLGPQAAAALDDRVVLICAPPERLSWCIRQYKGTADEPTLASANAVFAKIGRETRQRNALTYWLDISGVVAAARKELSQPSRQLEAINAMADLDHIEGIISGLTLEERSLVTDVSVLFKDGHQSLVYDMIRTPALSTSGLAAVPADAVALVSLALSEAGGGIQNIDAAQQALRRITGLDIGRELFANIEQINLFAMPPTETAMKNPLAQLAGPVVPSLGLVIASRDSNQTRQLLDRLLTAATLVTGAEGAAQPEKEGAQALRHYSLGPEIDCYVGYVGEATVIALSREVVDASLAAAEKGDSVLTAGAFPKHLIGMPPHTSKLALLNVGGAMRMAEGYLRTQQGFQETQSRLLSQLAQAFSNTLFQFRTVETPRALELRAARCRRPLQDAWGTSIQSSATRNLRSSWFRRTRETKRCSRKSALSLRPYGTDSSWAGLSSQTRRHSSATCAPIP